MANPNKQGKINWLVCILLFWLGIIPGIIYLVVKFNGARNLSAEIGENVNKSRNIVKQVQHTTIYLKFKNYIKKVL